MNDSFRPRGLQGPDSGSQGQERAGRAAAIGRIVLFTLLALFFLFAGIGLVIQPALRWGGMLLVTLALVCGSFGLLGAVELRGKRIRSGGRRATRWAFGTACVVCAWLATASALALGSGDGSVYILVMLVVGVGGFTYLALVWWRFERAQHTKLGRWG